MIKVYANICPNCWDLIFSRTRHDLRYCSCSNIHIDGGFNYVRGGWVDEPPYRVMYKIEQLKAELYKDYALFDTKYGLIKNWKLSILDFFNQKDTRCVEAVKNYIENNIWPKNFPLDHLTFPENWKTELIVKLLLDENKTSFR